LLSTHLPPTKSHDYILFFFTDPATTEIYTLSLHDALPISPTETARSADPGRPTVERPGPSLPALIVNTTSGWAMRNALTIESMTARSPGSLPIPQLRFSTRGKWRCSA